MSAQLTSCWVISDGRRGIENQALGLAEALAQLMPLNITTHILQSGKLFKALPPSVQLSLKSKPKRYGLSQTGPQIAIGCGRQAIAPLRALKAKYRAGIFTIYVQDPRINPAHFDLVVSPEHDKARGPNVLTMIGSPNRINAERLQQGALAFSDIIDPMPMPRVAVLIGGTSKTHELSESLHTTHVQAICKLAKDGHTVMMTTSRRTPDWAVSAYQEMTKDRRNVWLWDGKGENPYFAFLGSADAILVTEDSTNMLTEACATGKPVFTLPMKGEPGKFTQLYEALNTRCHVKPFTGSIDAAAYEPLNETNRIANLIETKITMARLSKK